LKNPGRNFDPGFFAKDFCHSERSEETRIFFAAALKKDNQRCFALLNMTDMLCSVPRFNALTVQRI
jgi:hypothetical protein